LIGSQCWMKENLNYATGNSWCYDDYPANCSTYGRLYDWFTIMNGEQSSNTVPSGVQGICPDGWHIPSQAEWSILIDLLGSSAGGEMKEAGYSHWQEPNTGATNSSGFTALPGGLRHHDGNFVKLTLHCYFWSSTQETNTKGWGRLIYYNQDNAGPHNAYKEAGFSVRCLKD